MFFLPSRFGQLEPPSPTYYDPASDPDQIPTPVTETWISTEDAIGDLSFLCNGEKAQEYTFTARTEYQPAMRENINLGPFNHKATNHSARVQKRFRHLGHGESGDDLPLDYQTKKHSLQRWHPDEPAPTITTLPDDFVHYQWPRIPTVRKLARLQSFPDWFEFKGPRTTSGKRRKSTVPRYSQVGNAVPPRLAKNVGLEIRRQIRTAATV